MDLEFVVKKIEVIEKTAQDGNRNLILETDVQSNLVKVKEVIYEYENGERDLEKLQTAKQMIDLSSEESIELFSSLKTKVSSAYLNIKDLRPLNKEIAKIMADQKFNLNMLFDKISLLKEEFESSINIIKKLESEYPAITQNTASTAECLVFFLALDSAKMQRMISYFPEDPVELDKKSGQYMKVFDLIEQTFFNHLDKNMEDQLAWIELSRKNLFEDLELIEEQIQVAIQKMEN